MCIHRLSELGDGEVRKSLSALNSVACMKFFAFLPLKLVETCIDGTAFMQPKALPIKSTTTELITKKEPDCHPIN